MRLFWRLLSTLSWILAFSRGAGAVGRRGARRAMFRSSRRWFR